MAGLVQQSHDLAQLHAGASQHRGQRGARGGGTQRRGQQALGVLDEGAVGGLLRCPATGQRGGVFAKCTAGIRFAKDALGQGQQLTAAQLDRPAARQRCRPVRVRVQVVGSGKLVLQQRAIPHRHEHECRHIGQQ